MLDDNMTIPKEEKAEYKPLPDDIYQVEFLDVAAEQSETYDSKKARQSDPSLAPVMETIFNFQFTVLDGGEFDGKPVRGRNVWANFVPSVLYVGKNGKNALYQIVEALQGQPLSPEQEAVGITGKDINALIGLQCRIMTKQKAKNDKTFMNVVSYLPIKGKLAALTEEEKENARVKPKDTDAEKKAEAQYEGADLNEEDVPFPNEA